MKVVMAVWTFMGTTFREAGARVRYNVFLRDVNVGVPAADGRRIEVLATSRSLEVSNWLRTSHCGAF